MLKPSFEPGSSRIPMLPLESDLSLMAEVDAALKSAGKERGI